MKKPDPSQAIIDELIEFFTKHCGKVVAFQCKMPKDHEGQCLPEPVEDPMKYEPSDRSLGALKRDLAVLDGDPPYDGGNNICKNDYVYTHSLVVKWGASIDELRQRLSA